MYYMCDTYHVNKGTALFDISITKQEFEDEARIYIYIYVVYIDQVLWCSDIFFI